MIRKLKARFVLMTMASLLALLVIIVAGMNLINYRSVSKEADMTLSFLSQNKGRFPDPAEGDPDLLPPGMSPELPYESRYFSVDLDSGGDVIRSEMSKIASVDEVTAKEYAVIALKRISDRGFVGKFRFVRYDDGEYIRIIFLDCGRTLDSFFTFLYASSAMAFAGFLIVFFVVVIFSERIVRPIAESYEKQRRFITDAGHEIKTPLTVINANVDILEMDIEKNESLDDIRFQCERLTSLTNDLITLSRMEEAEKPLQMIDFPLSEAVLETVKTFKMPAQAQNKAFEIRVQPNLTLNGNDKSIRRLVSVLADNALKYSPPGGNISLELCRQAKTVNLTVVNSTETEISDEILSHVFDRFYREDASRNSETGGHGIGLSVAKAIVNAHGGRVYAFSSDEHSFGISVSLPWRG